MRSLRHHVLYYAILMLMLFSWVSAHNGSRNAASSLPAATTSVELSPQWIVDASYTEEFDNITTLSDMGWVIENRSEPVGTRSWFQGNAAVFAAHEGEPTAYMAANFYSVDELGTSNTWAFLPEWPLRNGDEFSFYTRGVSNGFADRLEVRLSASGSSTHTGVGPEDTGDFDVLLLSINELLAPNGYPTAWTEYRFFVSGLPDTGPVDGRLAFRYHVPDSGVGGSNGDYIGVDSLSYLPYQPGISVASTVGATPACEAGSAGRLDDTDEFYLCHSITNEGNVALTGVAWEDSLGSTGALSTLPSPLTALAAGESATWVSGTHAVGTARELTLTADWLASNDERAADRQVASSSARVEALRQLSVAPVAVDASTVVAGTSTDVISFGLSSTGLAQVNVTGLELAMTSSSTGGSPVGAQTLLNVVSVLLDDQPVGATPSFSDDGISIALAAPLTLAPGESVMVTVRASTRTALAPTVAAGLLVFAGLGVAMRSRRRQLLAVSAVLLMVLAACTPTGATATEVKLTAKLVEVPSDAHELPAGLPASGPEITVTY